jgi:hypothetical protein
MKRGARLVGHAEWGTPSAGTRFSLREAEQSPPSMFRFAKSGIWWAHQDSNLGPADYESGALTN